MLLVHVISRLFLLRARPSSQHVIIERCVRSAVVSMGSKRDQVHHRRLQHQWQLSGFHVTSVWSAQDFSDLLCEGETENPTLWRGLWILQNTERLVYKYRLHFFTKSVVSLVFMFRICQDKGLLFFCVLLPLFWHFNTKVITVIKRCPSNGLSFTPQTKLTLFFLRQKAHISVTLADQPALLCITLFATLLYITDAALFQQLHGVTWQSVDWLQIWAQRLNCVIIACPIQPSFCATELPDHCVTV